MKFLLCGLCITSLLCGGERGWNSPELAQAYFEHSEVQQGWAWEFLGEYSFNGDENVLDFGCGDGKITAAVSRLLPEGSITGVDLSKHMIRLARTYFPKTTYGNLEFYETESKNFSEISGVYDVIVSFSVFHFVDQPVEILRHFKDHLHSNGKLLLVIPLPPLSVTRLAADECFLKYNISPPWQSPSYSSKLSMRSIESAKEKLMQAGYDILFLEKMNEPSIFRDTDDLIDWFIGTASANWGIPFELSQSFFCDVVKKMIELDPSLLDETGCVILPQSRIKLIAMPN